jgi:hypothetical protein
MLMRIFVVEEAAIASNIADAWAGKDYVADIARDGEEDKLRLG